jgi:Tfp pilus assembly pilus retraction ATPase PilT
MPEPYRQERRHGRGTRRKGALVVRAELLEVARHGPIREAKTAGIQSAIQSGKKDGMLPLERCLADLVQRRQIALEEARAVANDPGVLTSYLSG